MTFEAVGWYGPKPLLPVKSVVCEVLTVDVPLEVSVSKFDEGAMDDTADCKSDMVSSFKLVQNMLFSICGAPGDMGGFWMWMKPGAALCAGNCVGWFSGHLLIVMILEAPDAAVPGLENGWISIDGFRGSFFLVK
jgi:hypothetical protein